MSETNEKDYVSVKEAAAILVKKGVLKKSDYNDQAVKRLIKEGSIDAEDSRIPRIGYRVNVESLNQYVKVGTMKTAELRKAYLELLIKIESGELVEVEKVETANQEVPEGQTSIDEFVEEEKDTNDTEQGVNEGKKNKA